MIFSQIKHRWEVWSRLQTLDYLIQNSNQVKVAWMHERDYIKRTDKLDWVDPNPLKVRPANHQMKPPPAPRRYTDK